MGQLWRETYVRDDRARQMADRHYYRKSVGHPEFAPPGRRLVLVLPNYRAMWISQSAYYERGETYRMDGLECWNCVMFRNESTRLASVLIRQAIEATRAAWIDVPLPRDGFITYINEAAVAVPPMGKPYGWTYEQAGFNHVGYTRQRHYRILQLSRERLAAIVPRVAFHVNGMQQAVMFERQVA